MKNRSGVKYAGAILAMLMSISVASGQDSTQKTPARQKPAPPKIPADKVPVAVAEDFAAVMHRMVEAKPAIQQRQRELLELRYDLRDEPAAESMMARKKPVQEGVRVRLMEDQSWEHWPR